MAVELDARTVWHAWRRVMREDAVQEAMFAGTLADRAGELGLSPAEREVVEAYATTPAGTRFFIESFRFRMASSFVNALETAAPLTHRLMRTHQVDIDALAVGFLESVGWRDYGPYVYTYGRDVLDFLVDHPEVGALRGLPDVVAIERAAVEITIGSSETAPDFTPLAGRYRTSDVVTTVTTGLDVSGMLRSGSVDFPAGPKTFLVYLSPPDLRRRVVAVPAAAAAFVRSLRTPRAAGEGDDPALLATLTRLGVLIGPGAA
ncbi:MAG: hypothetical protein HOV94_24235 [Saccharothrix sp.]|nr:hypothetical protein [Saccharothrix sp.]